MTERHRYQSDQELGDALHALGPRLRFPETPDLASNVLQHIAGGAPVAGRTSWRPRRFLAIAASVAVLICAAALAHPDSRSAVADRLDLPGVTLFAEDPEERPVLGGTLQLGERTTLDEARSEVEFVVLIPDIDWLDDPDEVYLDREPAGGAVSFIYHASDDLPAAEETGVGALLSQVQGVLNPGMFGKGLPPGVEIDVLEINGKTAYWFSGEPHPFSYINPDGEIILDTHRLAGNTLLWQDGNLTLRLEAALDRDTAVAIAESMR